MSADANVASRRFTAAAADAGRRLDLFLASHLPELSRSRIQELIDEGRVRVGERLPRRAHRIVAGEVVEIQPLPRPALTAEPEAIPLHVLYEDEDFLVVNKPAGMVVHPAAGAAHGTLVNALMHRFPALSTAGGTLRPGIVHRLDRGSSGALVVARNDTAHRRLSDQFRARSVHKVYLALLHGRLARDAGTIVLPVGRDPRRRTRMVARPRAGREARTDWRVLLRLGNFTLVSVEPRTGRTHQIRAHFAATGHPLVGDTLYGAAHRARAGLMLLPPLGRVFLHAARLGFAHPRSGAPVEVLAPLDPGLRAYLAQLANALGSEPAQVDAALRGVSIIPSMRLLGIPVLLATLFFGLDGSLAWAQQPAAPPTEQPPAASDAIRQNVNLVDVLFTVFNKRDKIVADLNQQDFKVFDDSVPQDIRFFSHQTDLPLRIGLLLDTSNSIRQRLEFEQQAAIDFLFNVVRKDKDQVFLMTVDDDPEVVQPFTSDLNLLRDVILRQRSGGGTALYDAVYQACQQVLALPSPPPDSVPDVRRVLVVISDGEDNLSSHSRSQALDMAQRAGIVIYAISTSEDWIINGEETRPGQIDNPQFHQTEGDHVLTEFASQSGGRTFFPYHIDDLAQSFSDIGAELRSQYSLAYTPAGRVADGKFHAIRIEANAKGMEVHARKGYYAMAALPKPQASAPSH